jgi:hypothetical protein
VQLRVLDAHEVGDARLEVRHLLDDAAAAVAQRVPHDA